MRQRMVADRGETLLELVIAIAILGVCVVAFGTSIALGVATSDRHRKEADAGAYVRSYAELIDSYIAADPAHYIGCVAANAYTPSLVGLTLGSDYVAGQAAGLTIGTTGATSPCSTDNGAQQLVLSVSSVDGRAREQLAMVIRRP